MHTTLNHCGNQCDRTVNFLEEVMLQFFCERNILTYLTLGHTLIAYRYIQSIEQKKNGFFQNLMSSSTEHNKTATDILFKSQVKSRV